MTLEAGRSSVGPKCECPDSPGGLRPLMLRTSPVSATHGVVRGCQARSPRLRPETTPHSRARRRSDGILDGHRRPLGHDRPSRTTSSTRAQGRAVRAVSARHAGARRRGRAGGRRARYKTWRTDEALRRQKLQRVRRRDPGPRAGHRAGPVAGAGQAARPRPWARCSARRCGSATTRTCRSQPEVLQRRRREDASRSCASRSASSPRSRRGTSRCILLVVEARAGAARGQHGRRASRRRTRRSPR